MSRAEYIKCVRHTRDDSRHLTWCGREHHGLEWLFQDLDHVAYNGLAGNRTLACGFCVRAATEAMRAGAAVARRPSSRTPPETTP